MSIVRITSTLAALSIIGVWALGSTVPAAAQSAGGEVAYVESVNGNVVAMARGKPNLLDVLDMINDRTQLDLKDKSDLRLCHYRTQRIVALKGPARVSVTSSGVAAENGKEIEGSAETCVKPAVSNFQGGFVARNTGTPSTKVALRPTIKIVNRTSNGIRDITLWDSTQQNVVASFERSTARPILSEGQSYVLVVARNDGPELKMTLQASPRVEPSALVLVVRDK